MLTPTASNTILIRRYGQEAQVAGGQLEVHFASVIDGRAMQDTWIAPLRAKRDCEPDPVRQMFGFTLRVACPEPEVWQVKWFNPHGTVPQKSRCPSAGCIYPILGNGFSNAIPLRCRRW